MVKTLFIAREGLLITEDAMKNKDYSSTQFQDSMDFSESQRNLNPWHLLHSIRVTLR